MKIICKIAIFFVWITNLYSCINPSHSDYIPVVPIDLTNSDTLLLTELLVDDYLASYPEAMLLIDDELIVQDRRGTGALFHKIGKGSVDDFVIFGNGPEDYLDTNLNPFVWEEEGLGFYDPVRSKVRLFKKMDGEYKIYRSVDMSNIDGKVYESVNCGLFYLLTGKQGDFSSFRFLITDSVGNVVSKCGDYPAITESSFKKPSEDIMKLLYSFSFFRISPNKEKAVFASYHGALLQFFDLSFLPDSLKEIRSLQLSLPMKHSQISETHAGWVYGFEDIYATDDYVYAVYNGCTALENPGFGFNILVYDWDGNLKKSYITKLGIRSLAVDEKSNLLYLAGYKDDEMKLYVASMD